MKNSSSIRKAPGFYVAAGISLLFSASLFGTTHQILFGGSLGNTYSPSSLTAMVGDTILWKGDFAVHPLSSTTIPTGAAAWHNGSGTSFNYVITTSGQYNYKCDVHPGMVGSFTAPTLGVSQSTFSPASAGFESNITTGSGQATVNVNLPRSGSVTIVLFALNGNRISTIEKKRLEAGKHLFRFENRSAGNYLLRVAFGEETTTRVISIVN